MLIFTTITKSQDFVDTKYILFWKNGQVDTLTRSFSISFDDSIYSITYKNYYHNDPEPVAWKLPIRHNSITTDSITRNDDFQLVDNKTIRFKGLNYNIYKFCYAPPNTVDGDTHYFFEPHYGFLIDKSVQWGNFIMLTDVGKKEDNAIISFLCTYIMYDSDFFHDFKVKK